MNLNEDYYRLLQVHPAATQQEIRKAYRKLAHQYHPDKAAASTAPEAFAVLQKAYATLSNINSRKNYDLIYFSKRINQAAAADVTDPRQLLQLIINLRNRIQSQDASMINSGAVHAELMLIISEQHLQIANNSNAYFRQQFLSEVQACLRPLAYAQSSDITQHLLTFCIHETKGQITAMQRELLWAMRLRKYQLLIAILITTAICIGMYYLNQ